jgi:hypothetical protein
LSADTIANGYISVLENVHSKAVLRKFTGATITSATCTFTDQNSLTLGEAVLEASPLQVNEQVCNKDLRATWEAVQMRGQSSAAPADFTSYVAQYVAAKVAEGIEYNLWQGNFDSNGSGAGGAAYTSFDGICEKLKDGYNAGTMQQLAGATTSANILDRLADLTAEAPSAIAGDPNAKIFMSRASAQLYYQAVAGDYQLQFLNDGLVSRYAGYDIITPGGMPNDAFILSRGENLYFGTDLLTDHIQASVLDLSGVTGDDVTRVIMKFSGGTQVVDAASAGFAYRTS